MAAMRFDTVIFDLDGTLLDTLTDIAAAGNHAMKAVGRSTFPREAYRQLAGQGRDWLLEHALGPDHLHLMDAAREAHAAYNAEHLGRNTKPFPGIPELLDGLKQRGLTLAVLSNKPHAYTLREVADHFPPGTFDLVIGHREGYPLKPDPTSAIEMLDTLGTTADKVVYVGDTAADMQTGTSAGFFTVGVTWGFREREELEAHGAHVVVDEAADIIHQIQGPASIRNAPRIDSSVSYVVYAARCAAAKLTGSSKGPRRALPILEDLYGWQPAGDLAPERVALVRSLVYVTTGDSYLHLDEPELAADWYRHAVKHSMRMPCGPLFSYVVLKHDMAHLYPLALECLEANIKAWRRQSLYAKAWGFLLVLPYHVRAAPFAHRRWEMWKALYRTRPLVDELRRRIDQHDDSASSSSASQSA